MPSFFTRLARVVEHHGGMRASALKPKYEQMFDEPIVLKPNQKLSTLLFKAQRKRKIVVEFQDSVMWILPVNKRDDRSPARAELIRQLGNLDSCPALHFLPTADLQTIVTAQLGGAKEFNTIMQQQCGNNIDKTLAFYRRKITST